MSIEELKKLDKQYYTGVFGERMPFVPVRGEKAHLFDANGREYVDFLGGIAVNCLGYSDEGLISAISAQARSLIHISNLFYIPSQAAAAEKLCKLSGYDKVFFCNSGAEANEGAIKLARRYFSGKGKYEFIAMKNSFHGRTFATLSATGQERFHKPFYPLMPSFVFAEMNSLPSVEALISDKTCGIIIEPIIGEGGVMPAEPSFIQGLRKLCDKNGLLLIADEIQTGNGRTGNFLAMENFGVSADITTLAKGIGGGVPVGAFLAKGSVSDAFTPGDHGSTFGGNPLATAAVDYVLSVLMSTDMMENNSKLGDALRNALFDVMAAYPEHCAAVRGMGLMDALVLHDGLSAKSVMLALAEKGVITGTAGGNCLRFVPPYVITYEDIETLKAALLAVLKEF